MSCLFTSIPADPVGRLNLWYRKSDSRLLAIYQKAKYVLSTSDFDFFFKHYISETYTGKTNELPKLV